jgi:DNA-binding beta-propeller fold protein YncE
MRIAWAAVLFPPAILLSGCSSMPVTTTSQTNPVHGAAISGKVHGGQGLIVGASVYLYAASTTGYGTASTSLLNSNVLSQTPPGGQDGSGNYYVTTDSNGAFSITGDYTCPSTTSQLYLYSVGGNPGAGTNSGISEMAALGTCPASGTLSPTLYVVVNEVSTIATAYALSGFEGAGEPTAVGSTNTALALTGIANAFATVTNLEGLGTGQALATTPAGNGTVPQSEINTLANILAACVNAASSSSTNCQTLFNNAMNGSTPPADTATAALNIARNPSANIANLFALQAAAGAPFQPDLAAAPHDFTIAVKYTGGGLASPELLAIDGSGNVWTANNTGASISKLGPLGAAISPSTGYTGGGLSGPAGIAIDSSGNVWVANNSGSTLSEFTSSGAPVSGSPFSGGGLSGPYFLAIDKSGNVWVANHRSGSNSISEFNSSETAVSGSSGFTGGGLDQPFGIAIDVSGDIWVANNSGNSISEFNSTNGSAISGASGYTGGGLANPTDIHIDGSGNVWAGNSSGSSLSDFNSSGSPISSSGLSGGGLSRPYGIAFDADGDVFVANNNGNSLSEYSESADAFIGSGFQGGGLSAPVGAGIDGSGNIWITNSGNNSITEFVGRSSGVVTPIVANLLAPYGTHAVNAP